MKINAKIAALAGAALLMGSVAFAANSYDGATDDYELPQGFTFYNEVSTDSVEIESSYYNHKNKDERYQVEFAGINEKVGISYDSEKFWFELAPKFSLKDINQHWSSEKVAPAYASSRWSTNNDDLAFGWTGLDWGVRFTPFDIVDFYLNTDVWTPGGYLPIVDKHVGGNLQGDGFGVVFKPIDGLRIGLEVPFGADLVTAPNFLDAEYEDDRVAKYGDDGSDTSLKGVTTKTSDYRFVFNAGVDYKLLDMITIGVFSENILNRDARSYGLYANAGISFLDFNVGYTYNGDATRVSFLDFNDDVTIKIGGHHKANLSVAASFGDFTAKLEALMNFFKGQSVYDLYAGLSVGYDLLPGKFNLGLAAGVAYDMGNKSGRVLYAEKGNASSDVAAYKGARSKKGTKKYETAAPMVQLQPGITYTTGRNTFAAKANLQYWLDGEGDFAANVPVSWKYTF